jgi:hypothetical protein
VLFTQPVQQSGVPSQNAEHVFGEVFADSLASPAPPVPKLKLSGSLIGGSSGGGASGLGSGGVGTGGSTSSTYGSSPTSGSTGGASQSLPASFMSLLSKPTWLLIAYLIWQAMVIGTGVTLWRWRTAGAMT